MRAFLSKLAAGRRRPSDGISRSSGRCARDTCHSNSYYCNDRQGLPPLAPTQLSGTWDADNNMNLTWTGSDEAKHCVVERQDIGTGVGTTIATTGIASSYTDTTASTGSGQVYRISATNDSGSSAPTGVFPLTRYLVFDFGQNMGPTKITNSGYVLLYNGATTNYSCFANGAYDVFAAKRIGR